MQKVNIRFEEIVLDMADDGDVVGQNTKARRKSNKKRYRPCCSLAFHIVLYRLAGRGM